MSLGSDLWVRVSVTEPPFADLTDVTLADEDTNPILTDDANRIFQCNVAMQVANFGTKAPSGGQICNQCKWRHLVAKFGTDSSGTIWWPNLEVM